MEVISAGLTPRAEAAKLCRLLQEKHHETNLCGVSSAALVSVSLEALSSLKENCTSANEQIVVTQGSWYVLTEAICRDTLLLFCLSVFF